MKHPGLAACAVLCAGLPASIVHAAPPAAPVLSDADLAEYGPVPDDTPQVDANDAAGGGGPGGAASGEEPAPAGEHVASHGQWESGYSASVEMDHADTGDGPGSVYGGGQHAVLPHGDGGISNWSFAEFSMTLADLTGHAAMQPAPKAPLNYGVVLVKGTDGAKQFYYIRQDHYEKLDANRNRPQVLVGYKGLGPNPVGGRYLARKDYNYYWYPLCGGKLDQSKQAVTPAGATEVVLSCH